MQAMRGATTHGLINKPAQATRRPYGGESWQLIVMGEDEPDPAFVARLAVVKG